MVDYIVVGFGLAGLSFIEQLEQHKKSFVVYEDRSQQSSRVAGGLYNPVILKRFTMAWEAHQQMDVAKSFYEGIERKLEHKLRYPLPVLRRFNAIEEQNLWFEALDKPFLSQFLSPDLIPNTNKGLDIPYHFGRVKDTGRIDVKQVLELYLTYLEHKKCVQKESFEYANLTIHEDGVEYNGVQARHVVFVEGFGMLKNPFFNTLPLYGNKGEYLIIESAALQLEAAVKSSIFIIPLGNDYYKVGATYDHKDMTATPTVAARVTLEQKLKTFLNVPYTVIDQVAGIRPTIRDRRPVVGTHLVYSSLHVINGLGSRGVLIAPTVAKQLYDCIEEGVPLTQEINVNRFYSERTSN